MYYICIYVCYACISHLLISVLVNMFIYVASVYVFIIELVSMCVSGWVLVDCCVCMLC